MRTRCPDCQTIFRVTPEQLKARAGKVRCGHCQSVFNALDSLLDDETKIVTSRLGPDRFRVAGTAEFNGENKDIRADRTRPLIDWVARCFPGISTRHVVPWAGLRPMMPDMMPRVGRGKKANVFYNTGHGHLGWTLSAATAEQVAEVITVAAAETAGRPVLVGQRAPA